MNGIHDMGGMDGFGPVEPELSEPVFHAEWERRVFALSLATGGLMPFTINESRYMREQIDPIAGLEARRDVHVDARRPALAQRRLDVLGLEHRHHASSRDSSVSRAAISSRLTRPTSRSWRSRTISQCS